MKLHELSWETALALLGLFHIPAGIRLNCTPGEFESRRLAIIRELLCPTERVGDVHERFMESIDPRDYPRYNNLLDKLDPLRTALDVPELWGLQYFLKRLRAKIAAAARQGKSETVALMAQAEQSIVAAIKFKGTVAGGRYREAGTEEIGRQALRDGETSYDKALDAAKTKLAKVDSPFLLLVVTTRAQAPRKRRSHTKPRLAQGRTGTTGGDAA